MILTPTNSTNVKTQIHFPMYMLHIFLFNEPKTYDVLKMSSYSQENM